MDIMFWVYIWQLKEYRLDRLFVHLRDTQQGRKIFISLQSIIFTAGVVFAGFSIFFDSINFYFPFIINTLLLVLLLRAAYLLFNKKLKRPVFTAKALGVIVVSLAFLLFLLFFPLIDISLWLLFLLIIAPVIVAFSVFLFAFPTEIYTDIYIQKAKIKRQKLKKLQVIAVSGSYGKSSTKEVIYSVLSQKFNVVKTSFSNNTPLIIAKTILQRIDNSTDFFIVELGAYKRGEIKQLAEMVGPTISVTTAVSDQHLALYGDMNDVIASELELIKELPKNALALFNKSSKDMDKLISKVKNVNSYFYGVSKSSKNKKMITASQITPSVRGVSWQYENNNQRITFQSPLLGMHTVENMLPAVFLGQYFGIDLKSLQRIVQRLSPLPKTMEMKNILPGVMVIDDSFNASPESVASALDYLYLFPKRKFFVFSPLIELGSKSSMHHQIIGEKLSQIDYLLLTNTNFMQEIKDGIHRKHGKTKIVTGSYKTLAHRLKLELKKGDAVVFEGKEAGIVLKYI